MTRFRITYVDPETQQVKTHDCEFQDWTGHVEVHGMPVGEPMTITAREWAEDFAYSLADKGSFKVEELNL